MRLSVRFNDKWIVVPCGEGENSVGWLIEEAIRRAEKENFIAQNYEAVLAQSGGKLERNDAIKDVLNDSDFVHILGESRLLDHVFSFHARNFKVRHRIPVLSYTSNVDFDRSRPMTVNPYENESSAVCVLFLPYFFNIFIFIFILVVLGLLNTLFQFRPLISIPPRPLAQEFS